jgi:hypothetical protein
MQRRSGGPTRGGKSAGYGAGPHRSLPYLMLWPAVGDVEVAVTDLAAVVLPAPGCRNGSGPHADGLHLARVVSQSSQDRSNVRDDLGLLQVNDETIDSVLD